MKRKLLLAGLALAAFAASASIAAATVWTDKSDYSPGETVTISGDNSNGAGYLPGETVHVDVSGPNGYTASCDAVPGMTGSWSCQVTLWDSVLAVGEYTYTATGQTSGVSESGTFTDGQPPDYAVAADAPADVQYSDIASFSGTFTCTMAGSPQADDCPTPESALAGATIHVKLQIDPDDGGALPLDYYEIASYTIASGDCTAAAAFGSCDWSASWQAGRITVGVTTYSVAPGLYNLRFTATGGPTGLPPAAAAIKDDSRTLTITKEDTTTTYTGETSETTGGTIDLSATVADADGGVPSPPNGIFSPDPNLATTNGVTFELFDGADCTGNSVGGPVSADVDSSGNTTGTPTMTAPGTAGTYYMKTSFVGNDYYEASSDCDEVTITSAVSTASLSCHYHVSGDGSGPSYTNASMANEANIPKNTATTFTVHCHLTVSGTVTGVKIQGGMTVSKLSEQPTYAFLGSTTCGTASQTINISKNSNVATATDTSLSSDCDVLVTITGAKWKTAVGSGTSLTGGWSATYTDSDNVKQRSDAPETPLTINVVP